MKFRNVIGIIVIMLLTTSCATLFTGTKSKVLFTTVPPGATIFVNGKECGVTPASISMKRSVFDVQTVTFKLDGYKNETIEPETTFQAVTVLNFIDLFGWAVDIATGAIVKYSPNNYEIPLKPVQ